MLRALPLLLLLTACAQQELPSKVSAEGLAACRERRADSPPGSSRDAIRQQYHRCLESIDAELRAQTQADQAQRAAEVDAAATEALNQQRAGASATDRYSHCQLVNQQVIEAERLRIRSLGPAMVAARQYGANSPEAQEANANYNAAVADLERLIPESMRAGKPLLPEAVSVFQRCDPADFKPTP